MSEKKPFGEFDEQDDSFGSEQLSDSAIRARNRTVLLSPEITGQVRARMNKDIADAAEASEIRTPKFSRSEAKVLVEPPAEAIPLAHTDEIVPGDATPYTDSFETPVSVGQPVELRQPHLELPEVSAPTPEPQFSRPARAQATPGSTPPESRRVDGGRPLPRMSAKESPLVGFLVSYDKNPNGDAFELRVGRVVVTSISQGQEQELVIPDPTVSPLHAILRAGADGDVQVLDQLSEFGTKIIRIGGEEETLAGDKGIVEHGDTLVFGERRFSVCLIVRGG